MVVVGATKLIIFSLMSNMQQFQNNVCEFALSVAFACRPFYTERKNYFLPNIREDEILAL